MSNRIHVAVVGTVGLPACYGGFESLVENLVNNCSQDISYTVFSSSKAYKEKITTYKGASINYVPLHANGIQSIPYDVLSLLKTLFIRPDVTLILGVSGCLFLPIFRLFYRGKIITNIDGLEWKREKWNGWIKRFLQLSERCAVRFSDVVIADNQAITDYVDDKYKVKALTIAYGGDHALAVKDKDKDKDKDSKADAVPYFLSICRIEPENNIEMVLDSFSQCPQSQLKFVGNWDKSEYGRRLKSKFSAYNNIEIIDPIYDINILYELRSQCIGYVHGHSAGGTNPSLVEAMHFAKIIFAYDCNFNRFTTENGCCYFSNAEDLARKITGIGDNHCTIGDAMKSVAMRRYTWNVVREQYESTYTLSKLDVESVSKKNGEAI
ncbi:DUF1972 domain-containing protein [Pectobacterium brasiliense]|uniref:DUF1972 domain-containing protein n=1 Tax=Pectobacterium brasiliense TaxID=180957 RepID=UPI00057F1EC7|nr:DUF1972 domain-containing protein [Pectobacterium brasiliense]KHS85374.1 glycosyl transferase [Pectobacterium brasiliense]